MLKEKEGITLIALVITIIVLLILAGITLALVSGENGILKRAEQSVIVTEQEKFKENFELDMEAKKIEYYENKYVAGEFTENFYDYLEKELEGKDYIETDSGGKIYKDEEGKLHYSDKNGNTATIIIDKEGNITLDDIKINGTQDKQDDENGEDKEDEEDTSSQNLLLYSSFEEKKDDSIFKDKVTNQMAQVINDTIQYKNKQGQIGYGCAYFPAINGDDRLYQNNPELNFGTKDFTIEFWANYGEQVTAYTMFCSDNNNNQLQFLINDAASDGKITVAITGYSRIINTGLSYKDSMNQWMHYALVRKDGVFTIYQNGKNVGQSTGYEHIGIDLSQFSIGGNGDGKTAYKGYIDNFAIYNMAKYTADFVPSKTIENNNLISYFDFESENKDEAEIRNIYNRINDKEYINIGKVYTTPENKKIGNRSAYFPATVTNNRLIENNPELNFGTEDFTIEFWANYGEQVTTFTMFCSDNNNSQLQFFMNDAASNGKITVAIMSNYTRIINTGLSYKDSMNQWVHYALVRKDGVFTIYQNGKNVGQATGYEQIGIDLSQFSIGGNGDGKSGYKGYIDDFAIYNIAKYTTDFVPKEKPLKND